MVLVRVIKSQAYLNDGKTSFIITKMENKMMIMTMQNDVLSIDISVKNSTVSLWLKYYTIFVRTNLGFMYFDQALRFRFLYGIICHGILGYFQGLWILGVLLQQPQLLSWSTVFPFSLNTSLDLNADGYKHSVCLVYLYLL